MKLINSSVEIIPQEPNLLGVFKQIEIAGRTCYKSEDKITEDSSKRFVDMLIERGHTAPLEQGTIYLKVPNDNGFREALFRAYSGNPYSRVVYDPSGNILITTNVRVIYENEGEHDLRYLCEPEEGHIKRLTAKFILSIGIANEFVRHRVFSFCQESSRYCNYSKDKFGNQLTFIKPTWYNECTTTQRELFENSMHETETAYMSLIENGLVAQQARAVLTKEVKTELVMTGFESDWDNFFKLRCSNAAHPDARKLANELKEMLGNVSN